MEMSAELRDAAPQLQALLDERILDLPDRLLDLLPVGVYVCDQAGLIVRYNRVAAELWGCTPQLGDPAVRYCGSYRLYGLDGSLVPHAKCPMADVLATGDALRDQEIAIERPDGTRIVALVNIEAIKDVSWSSGRRGECLPRTARTKTRFARTDTRRPPPICCRRCPRPSTPPTLPATSRSTMTQQPCFGDCRPELGKSEFCGSWKLYWPDGTPLPHDECPMAWL